MSLSPVNLFASFSSIFSYNKDGKTLNAMSNISAAYTNGAFQVSRTTYLDFLDLSPEGLAKFKELEDAAAVVDPDAVAENEAVSDVSLETKKDMSEAERVETIRVNKNAVLGRVNDLLKEKGLEVSEDQKFDLKVNFIDGSIEVSGIEDPELLAAFNEALQGDEELIGRMRKTRDELGLEEKEGTVPRNFTIQFGSMQETPADAELEFHIDVSVNPLAETATETETETEAGTETDPNKPAAVTLPQFYSIILSNKPKPVVQPVVEKTDDVKKDDETKSKDEQEEEELGADPLDEEKKTAA